MSAKLILAFVVLAALTIGPAILAGHYVNRWREPADLTTAAQQVEKFPREFGEWKFLRENEPLAPDVIQALGLAGYISRSYSNQNNGAVVSLLLMVGQPGPLLRHPPYVCYANRANEQIGEMTKLPVKATEPPSEFNLLEYKPPQSLANDRFLVAYAMSTNHVWSVPNLPRLEYGASPKLYKVQLLMVLDPSQERDKGVAQLNLFATEFVTAFQKVLSQHSENASAQPKEAAAKTTP